MLGEGLPVLRSRSQQSSRFAKDKSKNLFITTYARRRQMPSPLLYNRPALPSRA